MDTGLASHKMQQQHTLNPQILTGAYSTGMFEAPLTEPEANQADDGHCLGAVSSTVGLHTTVEPNSHIKKLKQEK